MKIEFFFDCSSPWTYLAFERIQPMAAEFGAEIVWKPILVGGIFNEVNPGVEYFKSKDSRPPRKNDYMLKDMQDWAQASGLKIVFPPKGHPVNSVKVMRGCILVEPMGKLIDFARASFRAYFGEDRIISEDAVIRDICAECDIDADWLLKRVADQDMKDALRANVNEAITRGAFGSPTIYIDGDDMYFGGDRLPLVRWALAGKKALVTDRV